MIQDIAPHHFDNHFDPSRRPGRDSRILYFREESLFLLPDFSFPAARDMKPASGEYLFSLDGISYFLSIDTPCLPEGRFLPMGKMRTTAAISRVQVFLAWTALQILR